jgi:hypothetical protein
MKNHETRLTGSTSFPEVNTVDLIFLALEEVRVVAVAVATDVYMVVIEITYMILIIKTKSRRIMITIRSGKKITKKEKGKDMHGPYK